MPVIMDILKRMLCCLFLFEDKKSVEQGKEENDSDYNVKVFILEIGECYNQNTHKRECPQDI